jgi:predicted nucleic acid-binding protein
VILCDAGPLIALQDEDDPHHQECVSALAGLPAVPLLTTWPCLAEAMYLLGKIGGHRAQDNLWALVESGALVIHFSSYAEAQRMRWLMREYCDLPMDLADASLVAVAETLNESRIFTLDSHFRAYRIRGTSVFDVVP